PLATGHQSILAAARANPYTLFMPYEPEKPRSANSQLRAKRRRKVSGTIAGVAAILSLLVAFFNLYVSVPEGIPPEFPLFLSLFAIFSALWWTIRKNNESGR